MSLSNASHIVIAGAGSIGCYVGGRLIMARRNVTLLLRPALKDLLSQCGMQVADLGRDTGEAKIPPSALRLTDDPAAAFAQADVILVTVKSGDTAAIADLIARYAPAHAIVVSLQNGVDNVAVLNSRLGPERSVVAGMVPFNVVRGRSSQTAPVFRRATGGEIVISKGYPDVKALLDVAGAHVAEHSDMIGLQWSKLLLNLNNALNALSGQPLARELADINWRRLLALQIDEALRVLKAAGIRPARYLGTHPRLLAKILRLPNAVFRIVARPMLTIDTRARSSMWDDLEAGHRTEVDYIQGRLLQLAQQYGVHTPVLQCVWRLIKQAEAEGRGSPMLTAQSVLSAAQSMLDAA